MDAGPQLRTERLLLRRWCDTDFEPFAAMNADPRVMEYFPATLSRAESDALVDRIEACFEDRGYGLWVVAIKPTATFAGFTGLAPVDVAMPFAPAVELGWRLAPSYWGHGIAAEAARAAAVFAFNELALSDLVAYTAATNVRSQRLMQRLGMHRDPGEDFMHPKLAAGHPLAAHVLYRLDAHGLR